MTETDINHAGKLQQNQKKKKSIGKMGPGKQHYFDKLYLTACNALRMIKHLYNCLINEFGDPLKDGWRNSLKGV